MRKTLKVLLIISMISVGIFGCSKTETPVGSINQGIVAEIVTEAETESEAVLENCF